MAQMHDKLQVASRVLSMIRARSSMPTDEEHSKVQETFYHRLQEENDVLGTEKVELGDLVLLGMVGSSGSIEHVVDADGFFSELAYPMNEENTRKRLLFQGLFRICPALQYDAQKERERARREQEDAALGDRLQDEDKDQLDYEKQADVEKKKNHDKMTKLLRGELKEVDVLYMDEIQFQHVASGKFLTVGTDLALHLKENGDQVGEVDANGRGLTL
jgi:hypothetical protein